MSDLTIENVLHLHQSLVSLILRKDDKTTNFGLHPKMQVVCHVALNVESELDVLWFAQHNKNIRADRVRKTLGSTYVDAACQPPHVLHNHRLWQLALDSSVVTFTFICCCCLWWRLTPAVQWLWVWMFTSPVFSSSIVVYLSPDYVVDSWLKQFNVRKRIGLLMFIS